LLLLSNFFLKSNYKEKLSLFDDSLEKYFPKNSPFDDFKINIVKGKNMYKKSIKNIFLVGLLFSTMPLCAKEEVINPFAVNNGAIPPKGEYDGSLFQFNYNYPTDVKPQKNPWTKVLHGKPLTKENAHEYIMELKKYVANPMKTFVEQPQKWNKSSQKGWYSMLWAGENVEQTGWEGRESIYGTYTGQIISKDVYKDFGLKVNIRNHAAIYYNETAAYTLHNVWQKCNKAKGECVPSVKNNEAQFKEGAIVIKSAGVTATPSEWPVLEGSAKWQIYRKPFDLNGTIENAKPKVTDIRVGIFDIIVKDSIASPETGWVFATLVYDKDAKGDNPWDKMVPLGAMWGNDPDVNSAKNPQKKLEQNYINPQAPQWTKVTLGYGERLSGPFDIAVKYNVEVDGKIVPALRSSSCLSCHGTSSYIPNDFSSSTFFYPAKDYSKKPWIMYTPGSEEWNKWFQNRWGDVPQSKEKGAIALDYSTFLEAVLMNYAATRSPKNSNSIDLLKKYKAYRNLKKHY
jgi:hypothetical protein